MEHYTEIVSIAGYAIESVGILTIIIGSVLAGVVFLRTVSRKPEGEAYTAFRRQLGRSIILGLEFLIAGDIIRTVVVADTLQNVLILAIIILIRAFLSFSLHLEVEGRLPWQETRS